MAIPAPLDRKTCDLAEMISTISMADADNNPFGALLFTSLPAGGFREVRKAFAKMALRLHPDKNRGNQECADAFVQIQKAYEILSDAAGYRRAVVAFEDRGKKSTAAAAAHMPESRHAEAGIDISVLRSYFARSKTKHGEAPPLFAEPPCAHSPSPPPPPSWATPVYDAPLASPSPPAATLRPQHGFGHAPTRCSATEMCESLFGPDHPITLEKKRLEAEREKRRPPFQRSRPRKKNPRINGDGDDARRRDSPAAAHPAKRRRTSAGNSSGRIDLLFENAARASKRASLK